MNFYFEKAEQLKEQEKIEEALNYYQKSIDLTTNSHILDGKYMKKVISKAASIATINQPPYEKIIFYAGIGGLCNRLRALCGYLCLSYFWGDIPFFMCWYPEEACNCYSFYDLFEPFEHISGTISPQSMLQLFSSENSANIKFVSVVGDSVVGDTIYKENLKDDVDFETFRKQYLSFVRKIKPKNHLLQKIEEFTKQNLTENTIGLHIRRTDLYPHMKSRNLESNFSDNEKFIRAIEREIVNGCSKFFLATDNKETQNLINKKFPEKIISYCQTFNRENKRQTSVENALIDLYLLSKCKKIIGSYYSSFSKYASDLGNIPLIYP